jgi:hypothetical protein
MKQISNKWISRGRPGRMDGLAPDIPNLLEIFMISGVNIYMYDGKSTAHFAEWGS